MSLPHLHVFCVNDATAHGKGTDNGGEAMLDPGLAGYKHM